MAGRVQGKVALVSGAARGQGRSHALRLAEEGASIIAFDLCAQIDSVGYPMSTPEDLAETVRLIEALDARVVAGQADVRDDAAIRRVLAEGVDAFGRLDIVVANAGISSYGPIHELDNATWDDVIATDLTGVWNTCKVAVPHMTDGGVMVLTSSGAGLHALPGLGHYVAAKHGVVGLMRSLALELGPRRIRVNSIHSTQVNTPMLRNDYVYKLFAPHLEAPTVEDLKEASTKTHVLPDIPWAEPRDISNAVLFLVSEEARLVTGVAFPVDGGADLIH